MTVVQQERAGRGLRSRWRPAVAVGLVVAVAYSGWWWTHPNLFGPGEGAAYVGNPQRFSDATKVQHYGFFPGTRGSPEETITIQDATASFALNTADAVATMVVCTRRDVAEGTLTEGFGSDDAGLRELCTDVRPLEPGTRLVVGGDEVPRRYLVWRIEAARPGSWLLGDTEVTFRRSWRHLGQRGTETVTSSVRSTFD